MHSQLEPHFILNTLNAIAGLVTQRPKEARRLLGCVGDLLRDSLHDPDEMQPLDRELTWLRRYSEILESRHAGALLFRWEIADDARRSLVPRLLFQPLVENAVNHGALQRLGGGVVTIRVRLEQSETGTEVVCEIEDNGPGLPSKEPRSGAFGVRSVNRRLALKYEGASLRFESSNAGTRSIVRLPRVAQPNNGARRAGAVMVAGAPGHSASPARLRALIVEDEPPARDYLVELLEESKLAEVVGAVGTADEARQALQDSSALNIDVAFVDIWLVGDGHAGGLELIRSFAGRATSPLFVLATAHTEHAVEAFSLDVVDYLLKPFTEERVEQCLRRLLARRSPKPLAGGQRRIVARRGKTLVFMDVNEVWAFEARERLTCVHTPSGVFDVDVSLAVIELSFGRTFIRVQRNWLVNAAAIKELEREGRETRIFVDDGSSSEQRGIRVPVGRERAQFVRDLLFSGATGLRRS